MAIGCSFPSRTTVARGALSKVRRSRVRLARSSWMIPTPELASRTKPKRASWKGATTTTMTSRTASSRLKGVKTLLPTIWATVRLGPVGTAFTLPEASRWATSARVRPCRAGS